MSSWVLIAVCLLIYAASAKSSLRKRLSKLEEDLQDEGGMSEEPEQDPSLFSEEVSEDYFDYETIEEEQKPVYKPSKTSKPAEPQNPLKEESGGTDAEQEFNLRQAIIYQTILQNDYLSENK